jgi:hypothetical protein
VSQDGATGARAHAQSEAVHLGATAVVRLERSLTHVLISGVWFSLQAGTENESAQREARKFLGSQNG